MTVLEADYFEEAAVARHNPLSGRPFGLMLDALDDLKPNEVYICTGGSPRYALWGELMSARAIHIEEGQWNEKREAKGSMSIDMTIARLHAGRERVAAAKRAADEAAKQKAAQ